MPPERDYIHMYRRHPNEELEARCRIRMYRPDAGTVVVIVTELLDNPGVSITNWAEYLATEIRKRYLRQGEALIWIEHYVERPSRYNSRETVQETFDRVLMRWNGVSYEEPEWKSFDRAGVERLIGEPFED
jgi:hypothetical protein